MVDTSYHRTKLERFQKHTCASISRMQRLPVCVTSLTACLLVPYKFPENSACSMKPPSWSKDRKLGVDTKWYSLPLISPVRGARVVSIVGLESQPHIAEEVSSRTRDTEAKFLRKLCKEPFNKSPFADARGPRNDEGPNKIRERTHAV